jgi:Amt family ammonium transporter
MQGGLSMMYAGSGSATSLVSALFKAITITVYSLLGWWVFGYAWAYGTAYQASPDPDAPTKSYQWFIGDGGYFLQNVNPCFYPWWFFGGLRCAIVAAIVVGGLSGRLSNRAVVTTAVVVSTWIYPTVVHWTWSSRAWLAQGSIEDNNRGVGYYDFAGAGVIHCTAGTVALVGAILAGPRQSRPSDGHSAVMYTLGTFVVLFGFLGLNGGAVGRVASVHQAVTWSLVLVNTLLGAAGSAFTVYLLNFKAETWSLKSICNALVAGMVAVSAGADTVYPWAGFLIGLIGGLVYTVWAKALGDRVDDPNEVVAIHLGVGMWSLIAVTFFAVDKESPISFNYADVNGNNMGGIFYDAFDRAPWVRLGWNFFGMLMIPMWVGANAVLMFFMLQNFNSLAVADDSCVDEQEFASKAWNFESNGAATGANRATSPEASAEEGEGAGSSEVKTSQI